MDDSGVHLTEPEVMVRARQESRVSLTTQLSYGLGHVLNDVCASMWFTYLLVYFHLVLGLAPGQAGLVLLVGQLADGLATPLVGYCSDRCRPDLLWGYGRRKTWHLAGTVCVLGAFPFIFSPCFGCEQAEVALRLVYYCCFVVVFQCGWAAVQVSHLALIPELAAGEHERTHLTAIRYSFTVFSNITVYVVTWLVLHLTGDANRQIGPGDAGKFQQVVWVGVGGGAGASLLFHCLLREPTPVAPLLLPGAPVVSHRSVLTRLAFYQVGVVYMGTRLFVNLSQVLVPLYLHRVLGLPGAALASVPLAMFLASFLASLLVRPLNRIAGRKVAYVCGVLLGWAGCLWMYLGHGPAYTSYQVYMVAVLLGLGGAVMLVTSLGLTVDLIGSATDTAAFVYGSMSFTDKLANGLVVVLIQHLSEGAPVGFYRLAVAGGCGSAALLALLGVLSLRSRQIQVAEDEEPIIE